MKKKKKQRDGYNWFNELTKELMTRLGCLNGVRARRLNRNKHIHQQLNNNMYDESKELNVFPHLMLDLAALPMHECVIIIIDNSV